MKLAVRLGLMLALSASVVRAQSATAPVIPADAPIAVELLSMLELPVAINNPVLVKAKGGYLLKCSLSNSSEFRLFGLRYSLAVLNSADGSNRVVTRSEGFALAPYQSRILSFKTPLKLKLNGTERLVFMLEQVISSDYLWDVINSKEVLAAYNTGDYSLMPRVLRVKNQVDAPPRPRVIY